MDSLIIARAATLHFLGAGACTSVSVGVGSTVTAVCKSESELEVGGCAIDASGLPVGMPG